MFLQFSTTDCLECFERVMNKVFIPSPSYVTVRDQYVLYGMTGTDYLTYLVLRTPYLN